jgi:hypothetical protein
VSVPQLDHKRERMILKVLLVMHYPFIMYKENNQEQLQQWVHKRQHSSTIVGTVSS